MHLVFLNQYYPPDTAPTGVMLEAVAEELTAQGHEVTVICSKGDYAETKNKNQEGTSFQRSVSREEKKGRPTIITTGATRFGRETFLGKVFDYLSYYLGAAWHLAVMQPRPDRIVALTTPPYLSMMARIMSRLRGTDHAHWVMDLYPDVMVAHGMLRDGGVAHRVLAWLARWGFAGKRCAALLTLSPDMAERCGLNQNRVSWIPLWSGANQNADNLTVGNYRHKMGWRDDELVVMYSGNMGLGHRFEEILEVIAQQTAQPVQNSPITRFVFFGDGKRRSEIAEFMARYPDAPVELHAYAPAEILATHLMSADVHLVSLDAKWTGSMLPSKLQGIFAAARPAIFIGDADSSIGRWVTQSKGGWVIAPGNVGGLKDAIHEARNPMIRESRGRAAKAFAETNFDRQTNVRRVVDLLVSNDMS